MVSQASESTPSSSVWLLEIHLVRAQETHNQLLIQTVTAQNLTQGGSKGGDPSPLMFNAYSVLTNGYF